MTPRSLAIVAAVTVISGCPLPDNGPGDEVIGNFGFDVVDAPLPAADSGEVEALPRCALAEAPDGGFEFSARVSHFRDGGQAFVTVGGVDRTAEFDGQVVVAAYTASRRFEACGCSATVLEESMRFAILSSSQNAAAGNECPNHPLDGGVPAPVPDGGVLPPGPTESGFDAVRACGELVDVLRPDPAAGCHCDACLWRYEIRGVRR